MEVGRRATRAHFYFYRFGEHPLDPMSGVTRDEQWVALVQHSHAMSLAQAESSLPRGIAPPEESLSEGAITEPPRISLHQLSALAG